MKLVILDRDGTINEDREDFVKSPAEWKPLPGALEAISRLNHAGWHTVIATNQSGLARKLFDMAALNAIHIEMNKALARVGGRIDAVFFCPHGPTDGCSCRKPLPGMFEMIGERYGVDLKGVPVVGDSLRDLLAGAAAGCQPHLVRTGNAGRFSTEQMDDVMRQLPSTQVHTSLSTFVSSLLRGERLARGDTATPESVFESLD